MVGGSSCSGSSCGTGRFEGPVSICEYGGRSLHQVAGRGRLGGEVGLCNLHMVPPGNLVTDVARANAKTHEYIATGILPVMFNVHNNDAAMLAEMLT